MTVMCGQQFVDELRLRHHFLLVDAGHVTACLIGGAVFEQQFPEETP